MTSSLDDFREHISQLHPDLRKPDQAGAVNTDPAWMARCHAADHRDHGSVTHRHGPAHWEHPDAWPAGWRDGSGVVLLNGDESVIPADVRARMAMHARHDAERAALTERQEAERAGEDIDLTPIATWNAFSPDQLAGVIAGVCRMDAGPARHMVDALAERARTGQREVYEFTTERRDAAGALIGGARWRIERHRSSLTWQLHLLASEPEGVA